VHAVHADDALVVLVRQHPRRACIGDFAAVHKTNARCAAIGISTARRRGVVLRRQKFGDALHAMRSAMPRGARDESPAHRVLRGEECAPRRNAHAARESSHASCFELRGSTESTEGRSESNARRRDGEW
jgi:hypothetical protein